MIYFILVCEYFQTEQGQMMKKVFEMFDNGKGAVKKDELGDVIRWSN